MTDLNNSQEDEEVIADDYCITVTLKEARILGFSLMAKNYELLIYKHLFFAIVSLLAVKEIWFS